MSCGSAWSCSVESWSVEDKFDVVSISVDVAVGVLRCVSCEETWGDVSVCSGCVDEVCCVHDDVSVVSDEGL